RLAVRHGEIAFGKHIPAVERIAVVSLRRDSPVTREEANNTVGAGKRSQRRAGDRLLAVDGLLPAGEGIVAPRPGDAATAAGSHDPLFRGMKQARFGKINLRLTEEHAGLDPFVEPAFRIEAKLDRRDTS